MASMAKKRSQKSKPEKWYSGANIPMRVIRDFARRVAERFDPEKIILFGSYAYGTPHEDSDVDILVVMKARSQLSAAVRIDLACESHFPMDLIVRTPENLRWRLEEGDWFLREIVSRGKSFMPRCGTRDDENGYDTPGCDDCTSNRVWCCSLSIGYGGALLRDTRLGHPSRQGVRGSARHLPLSALLFSEQVLYEKANPRVGAKSRSGPPPRRKTRSRK
jgi:predicted nucleotidyltransferase